MRLAFLLLSVLLTSQSMYAQGTADIRGTVRDSLGRPLPAATIRLERTSLGTIADADGLFSMSSVPAGRYTLIVTYVGFAPRRIALDLAEGDRRVLSVVMIERMTGAHITIEARMERESATGARLTERAAPSVMSVLSAEEIGRYPDPSTAESMQRVPGVSITRVRGEARDAIVRGMEARYNNTLIDGLKVPSPATNSRVVQLDFIPSELLQRVEVTKSLTPSMEADAIGGTVNLLMRTAPRQFICNARVGTGYASSFLSHDFVGFPTDDIADDPHRVNGEGYRAMPSDFPTGPLRFTAGRASPNLLGEVTVGGRALDDKLGVLVALNAQQSYQRSEVVHNSKLVDADNQTLIANTQYRFHCHDKTKYGLNAKADYIFDERHQIDLSLVGFWRQNRETRFLADTGLIGVMQISNSERSVFQNHTIANAVVSGRHRLGAYDVRWRGAFADARQFKPDRAELKLYRNVESNAADSFVVGPPVLNAIIHDWQENKDQDLMGGIDVSWSGLEEAGVAVQCGGLYRSKTRGNEQNEYRLESRIDTATGGNLPVFTSLDDLDLEVRNTGGTPIYGNNNYTCGETVWAAYIMASWERGPVRLVAGARCESTSGHYETYDVNSVSQVSASQYYIDLLPSLHLHYTLTPEHYLRLSVGRTLSRPSFYDLVPYNTIHEDERVAGNPKLDRARSTNVDVRYEVYPGGAQQLSVGAFYKRIEDPIERTIDISNTVLPTISSQNLGTATNYGIEVTGGVDLFEHLIAHVSYTWTRSSITTDKVLFDRHAGRTVLEVETRPLQGQADHVANLALAFSDTSLGTFAQISLVYTGRRLHQVSIYKSHNDYLEPYALLDFSLEQEITERIRCFVRLNNLLDSAWEIREEARGNDSEGVLIERETFGSVGTIGVSFRY